MKKDETLATCQVFNAEVCYGSGLRFDICIASPKVKTDVEDFCRYYDSYRNKTVVFYYDATALGS